MRDLNIIAEWANDCDYVEGVTISPDGKTMVTHHSHAIGIWELPSGKRIGKILMDELGGAMGIDGMAVDFTHGRIACWNAPTVPGHRFLMLAPGVSISQPR